MKYHEERDVRTLELLEKARVELPPFCNRFFLGISQKTAPLTRLNYAYDLGKFFQFLVMEIAEFRGDEDFPSLRRNIRNLSEQETTAFYLAVRAKVLALTERDLEKVTTFHVEMFLDFLSALSNGEKAKARKLSCLRSFFAYCFKAGMISKNVLPNVEMPKLHEKEIVRLDSDEVKDLIGVCYTGQGLSVWQKMRHGDKDRWMRDVTVLMFFLSTGVRISELVGLNIGDIDMESGSFKVVRKGGNESILYMSDELIEQMKDYFEWYKEFYFTIPLGGGINPNGKYVVAADFHADMPLFLRSVGRRERLGVRAVQNLVKKYAQIAVPLKKISPHKLRSTFGTNLYRSTKDIYVVADVLGHKDVNTTKKHYAAMSEDIRKDAAKRVKLFGDAEGGGK